MTPELALKLAFARACDDLMKLEVVAKSVSMQRMVLSDVNDRWPENALLALISGPGDRLGLAVLDCQLTAGIVEKQAIGRVLSAPAVERTPTRTDAVICADLISAVLSAFQNETEDADLALVSAWSGYDYAYPLEDARAAQMVLDDIPYRLFDAVLELENNAKQGRLMLLFPFDPPDACRTSKEDGGDGAGMLEDVIQEAGTQLEAVLHRCELTLAEITALKVGALLPIPREAIDLVSVEDILGDRVSFGSLGAKSGHRAVRLKLSLSAQEHSSVHTVAGGLTGAGNERAAHVDELPDLPVPSGQSTLPHSSRVDFSTGTFASDQLQNAHLERETDPTTMINGLPEMQGGTEFESAKGEF
ncbi:FliM/FliN family flagellar motor C-terminal domain-containing protein [Aliiroseovarius sp. KMU-50]|uniref:FliM/FliN family flagellar motor C-terminal domain-containing protein n=1 Tax=Aliiroseovarius salicola TaxID=3009082 RepID=A0ABT4W171_9RHOB|nr:FliM/FliN family flagellar motor C-terminal domain-containing protein [Aliiroseovarius sp. KMU-50]MDA5094206.1 FliM/FliN family flagellar motor C-terminal domain-containing protein [Aliiroseovarius sp. KMU-50]